MTNKFKSAVMAATAVAALGLGATGANAATATGNSTATIIDALTIDEDVVLNFGVIVPGTGAANVVLTPAGGVTCGIGLSCLAGTAAAGAFTVTGLGGAGITVGVSAPTNLTGPGAPMALSALTTSAAPTGNLTLSAGPSGTATFTVGGTLAVGASQVAGTYAGTYTVTANYQ